MADLSTTKPAKKTYTLVELETRVGAATEEEILVLVSGYTKSQLTEMGTEVASTRIITDCTRDYGRAVDFLATATKEEQQALGGAGAQELLRLGIGAARRCEKLYRGLRSGKSASASTQGEVRKDYAALKEQATSTRSQAHAWCRLIAGGNPGLREAVEQAYGTAGSADDLALALRNQAKESLRFLDSTDPGIQARLRLTGVSKAYVAALEALANEVELAGKAAASPQTTPEVSQATVDEWDGVNLVVYGWIVSIFDAARESYPRIPRLAPIALRTYFGGKRRKKPEAGGEGGSGEGAA